MEDDFLAISALQHYAFCPRQFALIHVEQAWAENQFTAEGQLLHQRVDSGESEKRGTLHYERSVMLISSKHKIKGKADLLEIEKGNDNQVHYYPVEYKRGKPKIEDWDRIQLCAQSLCIEEMRNTLVLEGAIWYWEIRRRENILIDNALREITIATITAARELLLKGITPAPINDNSRCRACSLVDICEPNIFRRDNSKKYINELFCEDASI